MQTYFKLLIAVMCLCVAVPFPACGARADANTTPANASPVIGPTPAATASPDPVAASRELYKKNCAECHKDSGKGGEAIVDGKKLDAKDLTGDRMVKRSDAKLFDDIAEGSPDDGMPAFREKLSDAQINEVVKYVRELQKPK